MHTYIHMYVRMSVCLCRPKIVYFEHALNITLCAANNKILRLSWKQLKCHLTVLNLMHNKYNIFKSKAKLVHNLIAGLPFTMFRSLSIASSNCPPTSDSRLKSIVYRKSKCHICLAPLEKKSIKKLQTIWRGFTIYYIHFVDQPKAIVLRRSV